MLTALFLVAIAAPWAMAAGDEEEATACIKGLKKDISTLNLLNGLHLTTEQEAALLEEARHAQALREQYLRRAEYPISQAEEALKALRAELINPDVRPTKYRETQAKEANHEIKELRESYIHALGRIEQRVSTILTEGQKQIVEDFKPCLIPPKNLRNPTRAGQANDSSRVERLLSRSRTLPAHKAERKFDAYFDKHIDKLEKYDGPMSEDDIAAERKRVLAVIREARAMPDVEFELNKQELAKRIDPSESNQKKAALLSYSGREGKISRFLLTDGIVPILEERLAVARGASNPKTAQLDSITPAEDCRTQCTKKPMTQ